MPYWSSSRVGAVPTGQPSKSKKRNERYNRQKGITMEDLKKQTALRLAQEQQQQQQQQHPSRGYPPVGYVAPASPPKQDVYRSGPVVEQPSRRMNGTGHLGATRANTDNIHNVMFPPDQQQQQLAPLAGHGGRKDHKSHHPFAPATAQTVHAAQSRTGQAPTQLSRPIVMGAMSGFKPEYHPDLQQSSASLASLSTESSSHHGPKVQNSAAAAAAAAAQKSKLPHGLTVQELKEMTKARLQAEAADQGVVKGRVQDCHASMPAAVNMPECFVSSETQLSRNAPLSSSASSNFPINHQVHPRSPFPDSSDHLNRSFTGQSRETWSQDAWETGSVSTAASDYLGSEYSAVNGMTSSSADDYCVSFNRARSYTTNGYGAASEYQQFQQQENRPPGIIGAHQPTSYYDAFGEYAQNRRRAATLSPRPGLSHLHEDRPLLSTNEMIGIPSFAASNARRQVPGRSRSGTSNEALRGLPGTGIIGYQMESNRPRASSAASLPAISHTAEEFALENTLRFSTNFGMVHEETQSSPLNFADVFRDSTSRRLDGSPFQENPGLIGGTENLGITVSTGAGLGSSGLDHFAVESRMRAATWSEPSTHMFGPGLIGNSSGRNVSLDEDLAQILKLSVADDKLDSFLLPPPGL